MTRYSLLNDALARGQLAGSRCAALGRPRTVPTALYGRYLGIHAADAQVCQQFRAGFALGYDTAARSLVGATLDSLLHDPEVEDNYDPWGAMAKTSIFDKAVAAAKAEQAKSVDPDATRPPTGPSYATTKPSSAFIPGPAPKAPLYIPPPAPKPAAPMPMPIATKAGLFGLSRNATIALGVGGFVAIAGGIYFGTKKE